MIIGRNQHLSSWFDDALEERMSTDGAAPAAAWKRVLSCEVAEAMKRKGITKSEMAKRMHTSRSQLERLLDPENPSILLETVQKAAAAVGKRMTIGLVDETSRGAAAP
ncbi:MAG TPA: helix-turn-helix transcriptional regulator [Steroidobacteraceae bacterium]|jgi:antitoxin HicB|nr:helix-turn-helix transcriptional regulator [Steroidobacteraceae bacterium]